MVSLDWVSIGINFLTVLLGSGAALTILQLFFEHRRIERTRRDAVDHLALRLAFLFEGYAIACAEGAVDHETAIDADGHAGKLLGQVPEIPNLPEIDSYQMLDQDILHDVLDMSQQRSMAQGAAMVAWDMYADRQETGRALFENTIKIGHRSLGLADKLRQKYELRCRNMKFGEWDVRSYYASEVQKLEELEKNRHSSQSVLPSDVP